MRSDNDGRGMFQRITNDTRKKLDIAKQTSILLRAVGAGIDDLMMEGMRNRTMAIDEEDDDDFIC